MTRAKSPSGPGVSIPPIPLFITGFVAGLWLDRTWPLPVQNDGWLAIATIVGWTVAAAGAALFAAGMMTFARAKTGIMLQRAATTVVTTGPYRWSRNPMYVSLIALYVGGALVANTIWPLAFLPIVVAALAILVVRREERYMQHMFDERYVAYTKQVPRWL